MRHILTKSSRLWQFQMAEAHTLALAKGAFEPPESDEAVRGNIY
jgi:hypothetical protein